MSSALFLLSFARRSKDGATLPGLHPENKQKRTAKPTAERVLKAFAGVSLIVIKHACGAELMCQLTALSTVQAEILHRLGLGTALYERLEIEQIGM